MSYRTEVMNWIGGNFFLREPFGFVFERVMMRDEAAPVTYGISDITGLQSALDGKTDGGHGHPMSDITGLSLALSGKSDISHTHIIADVSGLSTALSGKSNVGHVHAIADVSGLQTALNSKGTSNFSGSYNDLSDKPTIPSAQIQPDWAQTNSASMDFIKNKPVRSYSASSRPLNTAFQISTTMDVFVSYSILVTSIAAILVGSRGRVTLRYADNSAMTLNPVDVMSCEAGVGSGVVVTNYIPVSLSGIIPRGKFVMIQTSNLVGTPTYAVANAQEVAF